MTLIVAGAKTRRVSGVAIEGVPVFHSSRWIRSTWTAFRVVMRARRVRAQVYHFHDPELLPWAMILRWNGACVIYDAHEDYAEDLRKRPYLWKTTSSFLIGAVHRVERWCARRMSGVIGATDFIAGKFAIYCKKVAAIRNFPRTDELYAAPAEALRDSRRVAYVGNIMESRGVFEMLEACRQAEASLVLAGAFETPELRAMAQAHPGWRQVIEMGHVSRADLPGLLASCNMGIVVFHPDNNWIVSQPLKLFEYMSAGLPVVASNFPLWLDVVEGNGSGVCVDPMDTSAIGAAIRRLCDDPQQARTMGENGRTAIRERYNWAREIEALESFYANICAP